MELGMIGLGRMGGSMVERLLKGGHRVLVYDPRPEAVQASAQQGASPTTSLIELVDELATPRVIWVMVPAGVATESTVNALAKALSPGDVIIDGGNSYYKDSAQRAATLKKQDILFLDAGTSGGVWGLTQGYSLMVGGDEAAFRRLEPIFQTLAPAPAKGYGYVGPAGAGHFVKMIHNGIEYGMMQAYAEGFELMQAKEEFSLDLGQISRIWQHGSVVRSWLLDLTADALEEDPDLKAIQAYVDDSGEGRWTVQESLELGVPAPVITLSLQARFRSRQDQPFGAKLLASMRNKFGDHAIRAVE
jgi:6-phosphogluconate dehydrogenase